MSCPPQERWWCRLASAVALLKWEGCAAVYTALSATRLDTWCFTGHHPAPDHWSNVMQCLRRATPAGVGVGVKTPMCMHCAGSAAALLHAGIQQTRSELVTLSVSPIIRKPLAALKDTCPTILRCALHTLACPFHYSVCCCLLLSKPRHTKPIYMEWPSQEAPAKFFGGLCFS